MFFNSAAGNPSCQGNAPQVKRALALCCLALALPGCSSLLAAPKPDPVAVQIASATPQPAPLLRFDGDDYYLVDRSSKPGQRTLCFMRDGDAPETCVRRIWIRKVGTRDLRSYEKKVVAGWEEARRDVTYRSDVKLHHSGWTSVGNTPEWKLMNWEQHGGALICCELEFLARPPAADAKALEGLTLMQREHWTRELKAIAKQAPELLRNSFP